MGFGGAMAPDETTKVASQLEMFLRGHQKDALKHIQVIRVEQ